MRPLPPPLLSLILPPQARGLKIVPLIIPGIFYATQTLPAIASSTATTADATKAAITVEASASLALAVVVAVGTGLCTARFLMSCFPRLERVRNSKQPYTLIAGTTDPMLRPVRGFIRHKDGDMDIASAGAIAGAAMIQELLFGTEGFLLHYFPSTTAQDVLQAVLLLQEGILLPIWALLVLRWLGWM